MEKQKFNWPKFENLVHYVIASCPDTAKLGSVKLHKILWKADTAHYSIHRRSITGAKYVKRQWGPTAKALLRARESLSTDGKIRNWRDHGFSFGHPKDVYVSQKPPQAMLSAEEQQIVDHWVREIVLKHTAESISEDSHGYAWEIAAMGEELPMNSVFVERIKEEPSDKALGWAKEEARRLGLGDCGA